MSQRRDSRASDTGSAGRGVSEPGPRRVGEPGSGSSRARLDIGGHVKPRCEQEGRHEHRAAATGRADARRCGLSAVTTIPRSHPVTLTAAVSLVVATAALLSVLGGAAPSGAGTAGAAPRVVRLDARFDRLVASEASLEKIADGFGWVEGPVWDRARGFLLFSDIPANTVYKWQAGRGASVFLERSGYTGSAPFTGREPGSNGLAIDGAGRLVLCEHGDRRIARLEAHGGKTTLADRYRGKRLNSPNDLTFHSGGDLYFTDPPFGLPRGFADPGRQLAWSGVYRLQPDGTLTLLSTELRAPNGIVFSPDERTLYVSNADRERAIWMAYEVTGDGTLGRGRVFFDATRQARTRPGAPDGMKVDRQGDLFAAGPGGVYVIAPDGAHLGSLETGGIVSNVAWGDDGSTLYLTADRALYRVRLLTRGAGF